MSPLLVVLLLAAAVVLGRPTEAGARLARPDFTAGMSILLYTSPEDAKAERMFADLRRLGVNSVSFVFPLFTTGHTATEVFPRAGTTPAPEELRRLTALAHRYQLRVLFRPLLDEHVLLSEVPQQWRGSLAPADVPEWFRNYRVALRPFAAAAEAGDAEGFSIGAEFISLDQHGAEWSSTIRSVRDVFKGDITYGLNYGNPPHPWMGELTYLGIDAFYELDAPDNASVEQLRQAWAPHVAALRASFPLDRIVFTEIGVPARVGAHRTPWDYDHLSPIEDPEGQARYYAAVCQEFKGLIGGVYWWGTGLDRVSSPFDPLGRPAANLMSCDPATSAAGNPARGLASQPSGAIAPGVHRPVLRIRSRSLRMDRDRRVRLRVTCVSLERHGCSGSLTLTTRTRGLRRTLARRSLRMADGATRVLRMRISQRDARRLRRLRAPIRVVLRTVLREGEGARRGARQTLRLGVV